MVAATTGGSGDAGAVFFGCDRASILGERDRFNMTVDLGEEAGSGFPRESVIFGVLGCFGPTTLGVITSVVAGSGEEATVLLGVVTPLGVITRIVVVDSTPPPDHMAHNFAPWSPVMIPSWTAAITEASLIS